MKNGQNSLNLPQNSEMLTREMKKVSKGFSQRQIVHNLTVFHLLFCINELEAVVVSCFFFFERRVKVIRFRNLMIL